MRNFFLIWIIIFLALSGVSAQVTFSGILDSTVAMSIGAADSPGFTIGIEEFANIRFQARLRESGTFFGAVNLIAAAGNFAYDANEMAGFSTPVNINSTVYFYGANYIFGFELERLYFRLNFEHTDMDVGLFRLPFGYGQIWGPSDFLNPRNPLKPDSRPRGILGASFAWYSANELKLLGFYSAPRDPFSHIGKGSLVGFSLEKHWDKASLQALYSYETPNDGSSHGIHRAGFSVKADVKVGLYMDALYTYNHEAETELDGLSVTAGIDYSFFDGNLIVIAEYLYNGKNSSTAFDSDKNMLGSGNTHNLYTGLTWRFNDFTNMNIALLSTFEDISFTPVITLNHDIVQGVALTISVQAPLTLDSFNGVFLSTRIRLRF